MPKEQGVSRQRLDQNEIDSRLLTMEQWSQCGEAIQRTVTFPTYMDGIAFVAEVATLAEAADHHPDILVRYAKVTVTLMTHDAQGITGKDFDLAAAVDQVASAVA